MKILIDATEITPNRRFASIPIYINRYLSAIPKVERENYLLLINPGCESFFCINYPEFKTITYKFRGWNKYWQHNPLYIYTLYKFNKLIKIYNIDAIFIPTDYPLYLQDKICCKKIIVIHDLKGIKRNCNTIRNAIESFLLNKMYSRHIESADKIIAISKYTKQDIITYYPQIEENKIQLIYNSILLPKEIHKPVNFKENKYILYVNTLHRYKNIITLIKAFNLISDEIEHNLVIVGNETQYWYNVIIDFICNNKLNNRIIHLHGLSNEELNYLYQNASLFVTPSLNEGFGFTPIEAAINKCPVLSSVEEALLDSTQGLLNYYYPAMDEQSLAQKIKHILFNPPSNHKLKEIANLFETLYSPEVQEKQIKEVINNILNK